METDEQERRVYVAVDAKGDEIGRVRAPGWDWAEGGLNFQLWDTKPDEWHEWKKSRHIVRLGPDGQRGASRRWDGTAYITKGE